MLNPIRSAISLVPLLCLSLSLHSPVVGQQTTEGGERQSQSSEQKLTLPATDGLLNLRVRAPQEVRVGEGYQLTATLENTSDSVELHDIKIEAKTTGSIELQSSSLDKSQNESQQKSSKDEKNSSESDQEAKEKNKKKQNESGDSQSSDDSGKKNWKIKKLSPGETREIEIEAVGDEQEKGGLCFSIVSYRQSLCVTTEVTKPTLELTKDAPEETTLCDVFEFTYTVKNSGTGDLGAFTVKDDLPEGLETESGDKQLKFEVDQLKAGDTRKFKAEIRAIDRGEFSSRATAKAKYTDLKNQSKKVTTTVKGPELLVAIDGPQTSYTDRPAEYNVRITNDGNQAVDEGLLELTFPTAAEFSEGGEFSPTDDKVSQGSDSTQQPEEADKDQAPDSEGDKSGDDSSQDESMDRRELTFTGLEAGESIQTSFMLRGLDEKTNRVLATASYRCRTSDGEGTLTSSEASTTTKVVSLPALLVTVVDEEDPVRTGNDVTYKIVVHNQGTAPDQNVELTATLPENLTFKEASGETDAKNDGKDVTFEKVDEIKAGEKLTWTLQATAEGKDSVVLQVSLKSDGQSEAVETEEPTQLFGESSSGNSSDSSSSESSNESN